MGFWVHVSSGQKDSNSSGKLQWATCWTNILLSGLRTDLKIVVITVALVGGRLDVEVVPEVHPDKVALFSTG